MAFWDSDGSGWSSDPATTSSNIAKSFGYSSPSLDPAPAQPAITAPVSNPAAVAAIPTSFSDFQKLITPDMLDANGKFKAPEQGGNYMDTGMTPEQVWAYTQDLKAKGDWSDDNRAGAIGGPGAADAHATAMLNPAWQPGVTDSGGFVGNAWRTVRPVAAMVALAATGGALADAGAPAAAGAGAAEGGAGATLGGTEIGGSAGIGSGTALGAGAPTASGAAGYLGMSPGLTANAVNSGLLNTGVSLARGNSLGDSVKNGIIGAALSPVGTMASNATTSALGSSVSPLVSNVASDVAGNAAQGAAGAALTGQDVGKGLISGAGNGLVDSAGNIIGATVGGATDSNLAGSVAGGVTKSVLNGGNPLTALVTSGIGAATNTITSNIDGFSDLSQTQKNMINGLVASALQGKTPTQALITQVTNMANQQVASAKPTTSIRSGGWSLQ